MATASPRPAAASASPARIIDDSAPRRRWVGSTVTPETAHAGTRAPPGTVSSVVNVTNVPTTRSPSKAPSTRDGSRRSAKRRAVRSASSPSSAGLWKPTRVTAR